MLLYAIQHPEGFIVLLAVLATALMRVVVITRRDSYGVCEGYNTCPNMAHCEPCDFNSENQ